MEVQIFGVRKSANTRKALRFFSERRIRTHFVDLNERAASLGELSRFAKKFGVHALLEVNGRRYAELGLVQSIRNEIAWLDLLAEEPLLLRTPLVRCGKLLSIGLADHDWKQWMKSSQ